MGCTDQPPRRPRTVNIVDNLVADFINPCGHAYFATWYGTSIVAITPLGLLALMLSWP